MSKSDNTNNTYTVNLLRKQLYDDVPYIEHLRYPIWVVKGVNMMQQGGFVVQGRANR